MPCMCGDLYCPSCGPAQGNGRCNSCGRWAEDGGCENPAACAEANRLADDEMVRGHIAEQEAAERYWDDMATEECERRGAP